jgi:hypothetical protein
MDFFAWDYNNAFPRMMRYVPRYSEIMEIDLDGRRTTNPCFDHPAYRAFQPVKSSAISRNTLNWFMESCGAANRWARWTI